MAEPFLKLVDLTKQFGKSEALRGVSFELQQDELLVVLGKTGAGKTTLLRSIAGLESPDGGSIWMEGAEIIDSPPAARDVALVFQNFSLYPDRTVRKNMEFPLRAPGRKMSDDEIDQRVKWAANLLKITHLLERRATRLSGGEMQRVAIGRAIVRRPRLFLMDEPLTNLDAKLREALRVELVMLRRKLKTPMIFVTHDQAEAMSMADRIIVLSEGRILQSGTPEEIYRRPVSPEVAGQLGQPAINLVEVRRKDGFWVCNGGRSLLPANGASGDRALVGIRPEAITTSGGALDGTVKLVEDMGAAVVVLVDFLGQEMRILAGKPAQFSPGDRIGPVIDPASAIVWPLN